MLKLFTGIHIPILLRAVLFLNHNSKQKIFILPVYYILFTNDLKKGEPFVLLLFNSKFPMQ